MPIHDQGYRRYAGARDAKGRAWLVIARAGIRSMLEKRRFLALLLIAWAPFVFETVKVYLTTNFAQAAMFAPTAQTFREFLERQEIFIFFIAIYVGAGLIANDRRANALQIYLSKPLTRAEYIAGKAATLFAFLLLVTWVPAMLLLAIQVLFAGNFSFVQKNAFLFPAITVYAVVQILMATLSMLALSSLSKSARFVGIMYAGLIFFTGSIFAMLRFLMNAGYASLVSPTQSLAQIGDVIFRVPPRHETPVLLSVLVVGALIAGALVVLERKVRGVEVVA